MFEASCEFVDAVENNDYVENNTDGERNENDGSDCDEDIHGLSPCLDCGPDFPAKAGAFGKRGGAEGQTGAVVLGGADYVAWLDFGADTIEFDFTIEQAAEDTSGVFVTDSRDGIGVDLLERFEIDDVDFESHGFVDHTAAENVVEVLHNGVLL